MRAPQIAVVTVALALGLVSGAFLALRHGVSPDPAAPSERLLDAGQPPAPRPDDAPVTPAEVAELRREVAQLRAAVSDLRQRPPAADPGSEQGPRFEQSSRAQIQAEAESNRWARMNRLESTFVRETTDAAWSADTSTRVEEALATLGATPAGVRDLECRASTCRLEISGDTLFTVEGEALDLDAGLPLLLHHLGESLPSVSAYDIEDGNGLTRTVLFLSRDAPQPPPGR